MAEFKYAIPLFIYQMWGYDPYSDDVLASIKDAGFDAIEVPGATEQIKKPEKLKEKIYGHGLKVAAVTGLWGWAGGELGALAEKDIMSSNSRWRKNGVKYIKQCVDLMVIFGCENINVSPGPLDKCDTSPQGIKKARENLIKTMEELLPYAGEKGVYLPLEPNNRYEGFPFFMNTVREALEIIRELKTKQSGIVADLFHMNIEEDSITDALLMGASQIRHIHFLDNNRLGPGMGHLDFKEIYRVLRRIKYKGYLTVESCPPKYDPKIIAEQSMRNVRAFESLLQ